MNGYHETYRGHVLASERDAIGHMNIQFYLACLSQAMQSTFSLIGVHPEDVQKTGRGFAAVDQNNRYCAELLPGDIVHMMSALIDYTPKSMIVNHRLYNSATGELSFDATTTVLHFDTNKRKVISFTDDMLERLAAFKLPTEEVASND